jgi:hypothetical protein
MVEFKQGDQCAIQETKLQRAGQNGQERVRGRPVEEAG